MSSMLRLREDVSFDASDGWIELHAHPKAFVDAAWQRWRASLPGAKGRDAFPLDEVAAYLREVKRLGPPMRILAQPDDGTMLFVFVLNERGPDAMRARFDRILRWTGVPVDLDADEDAAAPPTAYVGASPGTARWGLGSAEVRAFPEARLVVFGVAATAEAVRHALAQFRLPEPSVPPPTFEQLQHLAPDGRRSPPGPGMCALIDRLRAAAVTTDLEVRVKGSLESFVRVAASFEGGVERWVVQRHALGAAEEVAGYLALLAEAGARLDLTRATLRVAKGGVVLPDADHLNVHTAWTQALGELFGGLAAATPDTVPCTTDWGYFVDPRTMDMTKVEGRVPVSALVVDKIKWGREILTRHYVARSDGLVRLAEKAEVLAVLTSTFLASVRARGEMPVNVTRGKTFKNGNVELVFEPTRYDRYVLRLTEELAGEEPAALLDRLRPAAVPVEKPVVFDTWISESAKSDRSTCRTCGKPIEKGTLRRGEPHAYQGNITYRWHHDACVVLGRSEG